MYADGSVAFIDEFDKIGFGDRGALLGATEIQLLDINKGGIKATMPARTSIVAAANPKDGVYNPGRTVAENINLEPALLSRFDLVYVVRDVPDRARDGEVADAITGQAAGTIKSPLDVKTAAEYISLARQIRPTIQPDVRGLVRRYYQDARQASSESSVRLTSRQVSAVVRVATAKAKIELRKHGHPRRHTVRHRHRGPHAGWRGPGSGDRQDRPQHPAGRQGAGQHKNRTGALNGPDALRGYRLRRAPDGRPRDARRLRLAGR